ncbi:iron-containing alcohol dehydrogenase family protein [Rummeliibacillus pycnus]|uniref:iron-containing alcohol dehydrogenase family protein n=1 Tax=Rummeliibacillus pycnus TaxID=101070 RepID=UPI000C9BF5F4|nr:iron-containing alcohol dehydrogenase family protein [Rummeliibacillus pycnus]
MKTIHVHAAPSEYFLQKGALELLESKLEERNFKKVLVVHGVKSWEVTKEYWPKMTEIQTEEYTYGGECSLSEIEKVSNLVMTNKFEAIIGVGGGKVLDLVKASGNHTNKPVVLIPTLASNCAPWTPLSVLYDDFGAFIRFDIYPVSTSLLLIEPEILVNAPIDLFIAGIGDTLAKWYEADVQLRTITNKTVPMMISYYAAQQCKEILLKSSKEAVLAVQNGKLNDDFIKVVETIIVYAGMVGGFGDHFGRTTGAHSIHNGLTVLEETHQALHGSKVAYGILIQLVLENRWDEIKQLLPFYQQLGLPLSLKELGIDAITNEMIHQVAKKATIPEETIHLMPIGSITSARVSSAIKELEQFYLGSK